MKKTLIIGIDFGTYGSSYAFYDSNGTQKIIRSEYIGTAKDRTVILYKNEANKLVPLKIGNEAIEFFFELDEKERKKYFLLDNFKMNLNKDEPNPNPEFDFKKNDKCVQGLEELLSKNSTMIPTKRVSQVINNKVNNNNINNNNKLNNNNKMNNNKPSQKTNDINMGGLKKNLETIIGDYLALFVLEIKKNKVLSKYVGKWDDIDIHWVLTVPAIWSEGMKQTMQQASKLAGIGVGKHTMELIYEPEAAAITVMDQYGDNLKDGTRFMIVDCGGGTIDIVGYLRNGNYLEQIFSASGCARGGAFVDKNLKNWLVNPKGGQTDMGQYQKLSNNVGLHEFMNRWFEIKHGGRDLDEYKIELGYLYDIVLNCNRDNLSERGIRKCILIKKEILRGFFEDVIKDTKKLITGDDGLIKKHKIDKIFFVGGFSQAKLYLELMKDTPNIEFVPNAPYAVVEGATSYGKTFGGKRIITKRITKKNVGVEVVVKYDPIKHKKEFVIDNQYVGIFSILARNDQQIDLEKEISKKFSTTGVGQYLEIRLLEVDKYDPNKIIYSRNDKECKVSGVARIPVNLIDRTDEQAEVILKFGGITYEAWGKFQGTKKEIHINFNDPTIEETSVNVIDICFLIDATGSMSDYITAVKEKIQDVIDQISKKAIENKNSLTLRLSYVAYRDFNDDEQFIVVPFQKDDNNFVEHVNTLKEKIKKTEAKGGGDIPENMMGGFENVLKFNWCGNKRFLILISDAPCHNFTLNEFHDYRDSHQGKGIHPKLIFADLQNKNIFSIFAEIDPKATKKMSSIFKEYGLNEVVDFSNLESVEMIKTAITEKIIPIITRLTFTN